MVESTYSSFSPWQNIDQVAQIVRLPIGNTYKMANRKFIGIYM